MLSLPCSCTVCHDSSLGTWSLCKGIINYSFLLHINLTSWKMVMYFLSHRADPFVDHNCKELWECTITIAFTVIILFLRLDCKMCQPYLPIYKLMTYKQKSYSVANWFVWAKVVLKKKKAMRNSEGCLEKWGCLIQNFGLGDSAVSKSAICIWKADSGWQIPAGRCMQLCLKI